MLEIPIKLNVEKNQVSFETDVISGYLEGMTFDSSNKVEMIIESELGYLVFHRKELFGGDYFAPRVRSDAPDESIFDYQSFERFLLNEKLIITIIGMPNTDVVLRFRIDNI